MGLLTGISLEVSRRLNAACFDDAEYKKCSPSAPADIKTAHRPPVVKPDFYLSNSTNVT